MARKSIPHGIKMKREYEVEKILKKKFDYVY
jgi:hypothetical protein